MLYALLALAVFGLITSSVFTGMTLAALPRFFRERREAYLAMDREPQLHASAEPVEAAAWSGAGA